MEIKYKTVLLSFVLILLATSWFLSCTADQPAVVDTSKSIRLQLSSPLTGPESVAFDHRGGGPYISVSDGRVLRWQSKEAGWETFAYGPGYMRNLHTCSTSNDLIHTEHICGRPLGLQFHKKSGYLYIADAYQGLMRVGPQGGQASVLATEANGVPFNFVNGVDVDQETGDVYFTDTSTVYQRNNNIMIIINEDATGRLMKYNPHTNEVTVLQTGIAYPNGVAISKDRTHLVVALTSSCQLFKYWIQGPKSGQFEPFVDLPGHPDNVRVDQNGGYLMGLNHEKESPKNRDSHLIGVRVNKDGQIVQELRGPMTVTLSEVAEKNDFLWMGSVELSYVAYIRNN